MKHYFGLSHGPGPGGVSLSVSAAKQELETGHRSNPPWAFWAGLANLALLIILSPIKSRCAQVYVHHFGATRI
ncbi:hypothetical protein Nepgr_012722 [Nepenthes gracilis]|uniref:Uncharacterized protein n=1 Tax=Nepenthes gracilis TaxID=150966 RepID=A0AAD3SHL8_NEPGR|nr:hypothetical protein Nepgr_012722 [Nepenthes gracilis]